MSKTEHQFGPSLRCEIVHYFKHKITIVEPLNKATLLTHIYYQYMKTIYAELSSFDFPQLKSVDIKPKIKITWDETQQAGWFSCNLFELYSKQTATVSPTASRFRKYGVSLRRVQWQWFVLNDVINLRIVQKHKMRWPAEQLQLHMVHRDRQTDRQTHRHTHTQTDTQTHTYIRTYIHTNNHTYIHTYIHRHIRTHIHTYIQTHTHNLSPPGRLIKLAINSFAHYIHSHSPL
jgi:hypothetical protein